MIGRISRSRLYAVDALRGVAALAVVVHHWQHFAVGGARGGNYEIDRLPLVTLLRPLYIYGYLAVDLFFVISGFIFFWLYGEVVASRAVSPARFVVLRLSRLYPLHLATLLLVSLGQVWYARLGRGPFFYQWNDIPHFLLNLGFASSWGLERGLSFNAPAWSVSVEVLLYGAFFVWARWLPRRVLPCLLGAIAGRILFLGYFPIGRGLWSFFVGGAIAVWYGQRPSSTEAPTRFSVVWLTALVWLVTLSAVYFEAVPAAVSWARTLESGADSTVQHAVTLLANNWPRVVLMPLTVLSTVLLDARFGVRLRFLAALGELSYSSYMIHFPLQLALVNVLARVTPGADFVYEPAALGLYLSVMVIASLWTYRQFEHPMQEWIRRRGVVRHG